MEIVFAEMNHIPGIESLQSSFLYANLTPDQRLDGFVTTPFRSDQIKDVILRRELFVALDENRVAAYVFAGSWDFFSAWPIFPYMFSTLDGHVFRDYVITIHNSFQYGPICIDKAYRGNQLAKDIFDFMKQNMAAKYPIGLTFINQINTRSFVAHTKKMGLQTIGEFEYNENQYYSLAFLTRD